ncbi:MAG TPA: hypothetical protein VFN38_02420 [Gemmatimonadaceae bacterium]|nr:hypothetical protein [Gemmatimonadaceae bacterium]
MAIFRAPAPQDHWGSSVTRAMHSSGGQQRPTSTGTTSDGHRDMTVRRVVAVSPADVLEREARLFEALERAFPVRFVSRRGLNRSCDAAIVADASRPPADIPTVMLRRGASTSQSVTLAASEPVDRRLWGITLPTRSCGGEVEVNETDLVLAGARGRAMWVRTPGPASVDRVGVAMPGLASDEVLRDALVPERALGLIAIIDLLRRVTGDIAYEPPPIRAALLFDDPNLRWRSYGHIDYRQLLRHAEEHGYHAAMAMIPLDASRPHAAAASMFRQHSERLSLVIHGNNHERLELMQPKNVGVALELGAQALRRVSRFEASSGVHVAPIMVPPHGMCSPTMAGALAALPFDALCAIHPYPWTEKPPSHDLLAGWAPASFADGCAVILRLPFGVTATEIALRAYIDQPIVLYGHHEDVAEGLDVLAEAASRVNRLGAVKWTSLEEIARGNAGVRRDGNTISLRAYSHAMRIPDGADSLMIARPDGDRGLRGWSFDGEREVNPFDQPIPVAAGAVHVRLRRLFERHPAAVSLPRPRVWPRLRRIATESRDRLSAVRP